MLKIMLMTEKDRQEAAIRKAARELNKPLEARINLAERTIKAMTDKLEAAERGLIELRRENLRLQKLSL